MKMINHDILRGTIELLSGTRIGGSDDVLQIGGTDLTCIRDPVTGRPYIPGSSLKGRMRSCLEKHHGKMNREPCGCAEPRCPVCRIFGPHTKTNHTLGPTRIIVRDAPLVSGEFAIENKTESVNRRDTGAAQHPRTVERVAPGAKFALEIVMQQYDIDKDFTYIDEDKKELKGREALWDVVMHALFILEQTGIGAGTSKGYGKIKIECQPIERVVRRWRATFA
jgi:CRISPR-associated protein Csm3